MRLLVLISGLLISGTGAFCFAFYTSTFYDVAFLVGLVMFIAGAFNTLSYSVSGRNGTRKLTETTLVEGMVTLLYGFAVLNNQVTDSMLTMFFGTWLTLCGVSRFSQSLFVSRFNPRDWSKIVPLSVVATMLGVVMMLPWFVSSVMPLMLVGGAFLLDGFSMIIYAMYMNDSSKDMAVGEARARARAIAKKEEHEAKMAEKERIRNLSKEEREKEEKQRRKQKRAEEKQREQARAAARAVIAEAVRPVEDRTKKLEKEEVEEINANVPEELTAVTNTVAADASETVTDISDIFDDVKIAEPKEESGINVISNIRAERAVEKKFESAPIDVTPISKAVNLEELEKETPVVEFEKVTLPEIEFESDKTEAHREELMIDIDNIKFDQGDTIEYEKIDLEELVAEPIANKQSPTDATRFTQSLDFSWVRKLNEEMNKNDELL